MSALRTLFREFQSGTDAESPALTIAYFANQFPSPVEPYVGEEIEELRRRGVRVIAGSARKPVANEHSAPEIVLSPLRITVLLRALWLCVRRWHRISDLVKRVLFQGNESPTRQAKALLHTWLGAYYVLLLEERGVDHIHVHHGYFGSWIAMVAARLLEVGFSMTLHGSDLLLHGTYLDAKLESCRFCLTISEYNRSYILKRYPAVDADKVMVSRLGVELDKPRFLSPSRRIDLVRNSTLNLLSVGRLHAIKDHAFLLRACAQLRARGLSFECSIAGEGPERRHLQALIEKYDLEDKVTLLGHIPREQMDSLYERADVVVLTSRSEGIPVVLMEGMARGKIVLAPAITGIPELVRTGRTGFLYEPGSLGDFLARVLFVYSLLQADASAKPQYQMLSAASPLDWVRHGARVQIMHSFDRRKNLDSFADLFVQHAVIRHPDLQERSVFHEDFVLQQI